MTAFGANFGPVLFTEGLIMFDQYEQLPEFSSSEFSLSASSRSEVEGLRFLGRSSLDTPTFQYFCGELGYRFVYI